MFKVDIVIGIALESFLLTLNKFQIFFRVFLILLTWNMYLSAGRKSFPKGRSSYIDYE